MQTQLWWSAFLLKNWKQVVLFRKQLSCFWEKVLQFACEFFLQSRNAEIRKQSSETMFAFFSLICKSNVENHLSEIAFYHWKMTCFCAATIVFHHLYHRTLSLSPLPSPVLTHAFLFFRFLNISSFFAIFFFFF